MTARATRNLLVFLLDFLSLGALGGGGALAASPGGQLLGMPLSLLAGSPFRDFLVPGLVLFFMLGVGPSLLAVALVRKPASRLAERLNCFADMHWAWTGSICVAFVLVGWLQLEMIFIRAATWLHAFYMGLALAILFVALLPKCRRLYQKPRGISA